jgi:midasin (ATPase involved in ribosome maturation)
VKLSTHVFHESIEANLDQKISIVRKYHHRRTISTSHDGAILEQCCDFSRDLEEKATFEPLFVTSCLRDRLNQVSNLGKTNGLRCDSFNSFKLSCIVSIMQSDTLMIYSRQPNILRVSQIAADDGLPSNGRILVSI